MSLFRAGSSLASIASSSSASCRNTVRSTAGLHTSTTCFAETQKQRVARIVRKTNIEKKAERARRYEANKPHVVLGTRPGQEETKWRNCDLAKILITPEELDSMPPAPLEASGSKIAQRPQHVGYGLDGLDATSEDDKPGDFFFQHLPEAVAKMHLKTQHKLMVELAASGPDDLNDENKRVSVDTRKEEANKAQRLARVMDLKNANARGIAFENRRRIIAAFSPTGTPVDSGYPEVQVALLTMKIRNVWDHLMNRKKDIPSRRALRLLVHQRAKMLKYIKRLDRDRYDRILERVGVEPGAVEGELVV